MELLDFAHLFCVRTEALANKTGGLTENFMRGGGSMDPVMRGFFRECSGIQKCVELEETNDVGVGAHEG